MVPTCLIAASGLAGLGVSDGPGPLGRALSLPSSRWGRAQQTAEQGAGASPFDDLLVQGAETHHHLIEQTRPLAAGRAAQVRNILWRAGIRRRRRKHCPIFDERQVRIADDVRWVLECIGGIQEVAWIPPIQEIIKRVSAE